MKGVRVTMLRAVVSGMTDTPAVREFEQADAWAFIYDHNINSLIVMVNNEPMEDGSFTRTTIAEFPASGVESVEFVENVVPA